MKISFFKKTPVLKAKDVCLSFVSEEQALKIKKGTLTSPFALAVKSENFSGKSGELFSEFTNQGLILHLGAGAEKKLKKDDFRVLGAKAYKSARVFKAVKLIIKKIDFYSMSEELFSVFTEGLILASYEYSLKSSPKEKNKLQTVMIEGELKKKILDDTFKVCDAVFTSRDLVNENAGTLHPALMEKKARELARKFKLKITVLDAAKMKTKGMNLLTAVGQAAENKSRLIILEYKGAAKKDKTVAFIGKGITFDTGGLNLKPGSSMTDMRMDMSGAAAVFGALQAIASLKLKVNVLGVLAVAENAIGPKAVKPGDIIKSYNGKTVEILNTDAEGRLILADALSYIERNFKPDFMVDLATLTGAVLIALGSSHAALMSADDKLKDLIIKASEETDEKLWPLPFNESYFEDMKSDVADVRNIGRNREAGTIRGAVFLKEFVKNTPWAHLDIAGTAWSSTPGDYTSWYGTGYGVRLLTNLSQKLL